MLSSVQSAATGTPQPVRAGSVSIVIPTKNRPAELVATLNTVAAQSVLPAEIIIVDQSPTDEPKAAVESFWRQSPDMRDAIKLTFLSRRDLSGSAEARNVGIDLCTGEFVLFLDDDVMLEKDFIEQILATLRSRLGVVGVSGTITNYQRPVLRHRLFPVFFLRGPFHDPRQEVYWRSDALRGADAIAVDRLGAGLMCFPREIASAVRFDLAFRGYSLGEDIDFSIRAARAGALLVQPNARLEHLRSPGTREQIEWRAQEMRAYSYLYRKHWSDRFWGQICYSWLHLGFLLISAASALRRRSLAPLRTWVEGLRTARP